MSIKVALQHHTRYDYDRLINVSPQVIRLRPAVHTRVPILGYSLDIRPKKHFINWLQDPFGNFMARVVFPEKIKYFEVNVEVITETVSINPFDFFVEDYAEKYPFEYDPQLKKELAPYFEITEQSPLLDKFLKKLEPLKGYKIVDFLVEVNRMVNQEVGYTIRFEPGVQTCEETLQKKIGSCRDSGWLLVQMLRKCGLATRFVSGYLVQLKADQKPIEGPAGPEEDFTDLHAWAEVYVPGAGWIGLDATSGLLTGEGHIPLACTPDFASAAPITGLTDIAQVEFHYSNNVTRVHEDPRVTKPYTEAKWAKIMDLGNQVENDLQKNDVRLTMGGEPTFVSIDDMESAQWNTTADGLEKRVLAQDLANNLKEVFGKQGLIHYGQGKWYPGEPLPRWQYSLLWRKDGLPLWKNGELLANLSKDYQHNHSHAEIFTKELAQHLGVNPNNAQPAYEDTFYFLWEEENLPINIDPLNVNLKDKLERKALAEHLKQGLNNPKGYVLPLEWNHYDKKWMSCAWEFKRKHLFLMPGNSPIGLRLPLNSLPYQVPAQRREPLERSPFEEVGELSDFHKQVWERYNQPIDEKIPEELKNPKDLIPEEEEDELDKKYDFNPTGHKKQKKEIDDYEPKFRTFTIKKAICIEQREGKIFIFMPPADYTEHYLDLLAAIETTADKLKIPVVIEGYEPPRDNRIEKIVVTPDPGVIEVNVHPSHNWNELVENYDKLFEAARVSRLGSEKFMLDGRHTGTGGGNHITIGGSLPENSPLLRRPDLLRSMVAFWQNHPGLSYLFSTAFIGSTSQAPRVDEGRQEMLYELEIAFNQIPELDQQSIPFWLVDRIFRNLLIDVTGNTHRAEFCIDKLYRPDTSSGQLGILELRAFDMPPNKQMAIVQLLLIRTLIAWFWQKPYKKNLVRWGTELHDKFLMQHYVKEDLRDVVQQINDFGYPFEFNWLDTFFEFRFPLLGKVQIGDIQLEIRNAIEPWNVLGEEVSNIGTSRFVDSSLERVEVKVSGINEERYIVLCNGMRMPLRPTGRKSEYVVGVRYKAWAPPSALHPTLPVDVPLVFDIFDTWNGRSIGGCTYHVSHPGGLSYETYPVNSYEAETRRESRFWNYGHTQGEYLLNLPKYSEDDAQRVVIEQTQTKDISIIDVPKPIEPDKEYPLTFDLRKFK